MRLELPLLAFVVLLVAGCAGVPRTTLQPVEATAPGTHEVDMLVATTRTPSDVPGEVFGDGRGSSLSVENIVVSVPPDSVRKPGEVIYPKENPGDPAREFVATKIEPLDRAGVRRWYQRVASPQKRVIIFVHGFNNSYEDAVLRFAQIRTDLTVNAAPVLFTWPSGGSVFDYLYDRDSANYSRDALEAIIESVSANPNVEDVTLLAHSMGGWLAMEAVRQLAIRHGHVPKKLSNIVLASPDIDFDVFFTQLNQIGDASRRITIFTATDDVALRVSRRIAGDTQRLGAIDITRPSVRQALLSRGITAIDLSNGNSSDGLNHMNFADSPEMVKAIGRRLVAGDNISGSRPGFTDTVGATALGAAQGVGSAIGAGVAAPVAVISPAARKRLRTQLGKTEQAFRGSLLTATGQ
ncbi:alpha/beta fold hydrolase [Jiella endophytica]|uniref:Alpha/beta fold hydrolase n=1 Tax=Jiella endophytica TaxID=2558362 RepID=A0A4Y8RPX1_9HYPH|nr:alpha/beta hydrolase [Jiella endophytica]TFF25090.1 alpha/beta fold hydrolase [Jiella endophytica]